MKMKTFSRLCTLFFIFCLLSACGAQKAEQLSSDAVSVFAAVENVPSESLWVPVSLSGGSGKASVESPAELRPESTGYTAVICWSSPWYDYMIVDGQTYYPVNTDGNSVFEIPVSAKNCTLTVQADTTAMSIPHLIDYTLTFGGSESTEEETEVPAENTLYDTLSDMQPTGSLSLDYAQQFSVDYYEGGLCLITIADSEQYLLITQEAEIPDSLPAEITVLRQPLNNIYLVSSSAMDMFSLCGGMDSLRFCALKQDSWSVEAAVEAMDSGKLIYAGKYSAPDYELLCEGGCDLAIENMMIKHSPEVVEELESLGIPVLIERSSYEATPQGRMEWIKLYGLLTGCLEQADAAFRAQLSAFDQLDGMTPTGKTAAIFYVTTNGTVSVRNASDYLPKMIELAGGTYVFDDLGTDSANASSNIQMEEFYAEAKDADYLIYNSTISGELETLDDFLSLSPLFASMRAVQEGHVYCLSQDLYQHSMALGDFTMDLYNIFSDNPAALNYITKLE